MIPRGELDISWRMLLGALLDRGTPDESEAAAAVERLFAPMGHTATCLSVRSGLDGLLQLARWPAGSEVLMSAVNIPAMAELVRAHGHIPVPVDVSLDTLGPDPEQLRDRLTPRTRAVLVAHLFGSRLDLNPIARITRAAGIELWEDVAQGFSPADLQQPSVADVSCYSFGLIKLQTSLRGAVLRWREASAAAAFRQWVSEQPPQSPFQFQRRASKAALLKASSSRPIYTVLCGFFRGLGIDLDDQLPAVLRGFQTSALIPQLRQRPTTKMLRVLRRQLSAADSRPDWRGSLAREYQQLLPEKVQLGTSAQFPRRWVYPICSRNPAQLRRSLVRSGFDATTRGSQLRIIAPSPEQPEWTTPQSSHWLPNLIYLPLHRSLTNRHLHSLAEIIRNCELSPPTEFCTPARHGSQVT